MSSLLASLHAARRDGDRLLAEARARVEQLEGERHRLDAAIAALEGEGATEAPASGDRPASKDAGLPRPDTQAGADASVAPPPDYAEASHAKGVTADQVFEHVGADWTRAGVICRDVGIGISGLRRHINALLEEGRIEKTGVRSGTRYRRAGVEGGRGAERSEPVAITDEAAPSTVAVSAEDSEQPGPEMFGAQLRPKIEQVLSRSSEPLSARDIARSLVVPIGDVAQQLHILVRQSEDGDRFPPIHRDGTGGYSIGVAERAA